MKAKYNCFFWPALRGISLIVASYGFIAFLSELLFGGNSVVGLSVFAVGSLALVAMTPKLATLPTIEDEGTEKLRQRRVPWSLIAYGVINGVGFTWACVFLAFSRRYAFFSAPVVGATSFIMALYAVIGLLAAFLTGGNWRIVLLVFSVAPGILGAIILRLHLFPLR